MKKLTMEQFDELAVREDVITITSNGQSGQDINYEWHTVKYADGTEEDVFTPWSL